MLKIFNSAIIVIIYNKEIHQSKTLNRLAQSKLSFSNCQLVIWNNGPFSLDNRNVSQLISRGFNVEIQETIKNESLAKIYNLFISQFDSKSYIILDDDTDLNDQYLSEALNLGESEVGIPTIQFDNKTEGPIINLTIIQDHKYVCKSKDKIFAIGSGLVIGKNICDEIKGVYGSVFDNNFYLYGVDTAFCFRLNRLEKNERVTILPPLSHSLSRLESESGGISRFRVKERGYDVGLQWRYYYPLYIAFYKISKLVAINLLRVLKIKKGPLNLSYTLKAFISGSHYRNEK